MANKKVKMLVTTRATFGEAREGGEYNVPEGIANRWVEQGRAEIVGDAETGTVVKGTALKAETEQLKAGQTPAEGN